MNLHTPSPDRAPLTEIKSLADFMAQPDKVAALLRQSDDGKIYVLLATKPHIRHGELRDGVERINYGSEGPLNDCGVQATHVGPGLHAFTHRLSALPPNALIFIGSIDPNSGMIETLIEGTSQGNFRESSTFIDLDSCKSRKQPVTVQKLIEDLHTNLAKAFGGPQRRENKNEQLLNCLDITGKLKTTEFMTNTKIPTALRLAIVDYSGPFNEDSALKLLVHTADYVAKRERKS